jgi:hypothetical protein
MKKRNREQGARTEDRGIEGKKVRRKEGERMRG